MKRRGLSLLELLISSVMIALLTGALFAAYSSAVSFEQTYSGKREDSDNHLRFEERLSGYLRSAQLSNTQDDPYAYFISPVSGITDSTLGETDAVGSTSLVFTLVGRRLPAALLENTELDFEGLNQEFGPQGGRLEVSLSLEPYVPQPDKAGLFIREQRPADGDSSQGGFESVFDPNVTSVSFEFFDGLNWVTMWDSQNAEANRIPAAVRITYRMTEDTADRVFVVRLPMSDVTVDNPVGGAL